MGTGGENVRSGMLDLRLSGEGGGGGNIPSLLLELEEKNVLGEEGSTGVSGVITSAIDLGKSPTSGTVRAVLIDTTDVSEALEALELSDFSDMGVSSSFTAELGCETSFA